MPKAKEQDKPLRYCDDCRLKSWKIDERYMTPEGLPIFMRCPHYRKGKVSIIRGAAACNKFQL